MRKQTSVKFYHVGDINYNGTTLIELDSKKEAIQYIKDWLQAHTTKTYPFKHVSKDRWESKFTAIYLEN